MNDTDSYGCGLSQGGATRPNIYSFQSAFSLISSLCLPASPGGRQSRRYLSSAYEAGDRQSLGKRLMATEQTRNEGIPEKPHSTHTVYLYKYGGTHCVLGLHAPVHFKCSTHKSSSHQIWRGLPSWRTLVKIREKPPCCQILSQQHGSSCVPVLT